jgi:hypothetical protein
LSAAAPTEQQVYLPDGSRQTADKVLREWKQRKDEALEGRAPFEAQWKLNEAFASGNQWLRIDEGGGTKRVLEDVRQRLRAQGRSVLETDVLTQYLMTAVGKLAADDFRPELLAAREGEDARDSAQSLNDQFGWGWEQEWRGDESCMDVLLTIAVDGTCGTRCRYDRSKGLFLGDFPHPTEPYQHGENGSQRTFPAGRPILDRTAARAYTADRAQYGEPSNLKTVREGRIVWEVMTPWNLLPPPGIEHPEDFPYDLIGRAVHIDTLKSAYPDKASLIKAEDIGESPVGSVAPGSAKADLKNHALLYSGYLRPTLNHPRGQTCIWLGSTLLELAESLPYNGAPWGPRAGISYFRYWKVKRRFWGRALIEPGIGAQRVRNKRLSQSDEVIDRGLPKTYISEGDAPRGMTGAPLELVELKAGATRPTIDQGIGPGGWMQESVQQCDVDIQQALGLHDQSIGAQAPAGTPYAALAMQAENDQTKLGPIVTAFKLGVCDLVRDTIEAMRQWPPGKRMMIEGEDGALRLLVHESENVPDSYLVIPAKGGGVPRSQGAELQKITDLWNAALYAGAVQQGAQEWLEWYKTSLDAGQAQELPAMDTRSEQQHKAALENVIMVRLLHPVPVAPFDDPQVHLPVHEQQQAQLQQLAMLGDQTAQAGSEVIEQHKQMHLQAAQAAQAGLPAATPPGGAAPPGGPAAATPGQFAASANGGQGQGVPTPDPAHLLGFLPRPGQRPTL